ncbi:focal adhesion kinase 1 [Trichonephila clavipes]|nr:focal adhesion kinase 1 [Trichonephila clavipes]
MKNYSTACEQLALMAINTSQDVGSSSLGHIAIRTRREIGHASDQVLETKVENLVQKCQEFNLEQARKRLSYSDHSHGSDSESASTVPGSPTMPNETEGMGYDSTFLQMFQRENPTESPSPDRAGLLALTKC